MIATSPQSAINASQPAGRALTRADRGMFVLSNGSNSLAERCRP